MTPRCWSQPLRPSQGNRISVGKRLEAVGSILTVLEVLGLDADFEETLLPREHVVLAFASSGASCPDKARKLAGSGAG